MFYFLHISKCAGSTFVELAGRNTTPFRPNANGNPLNPLTGKRIPIWHWNSAEQQYLLSSPICGLIANENNLGHHVEFYERVVYVTILRDPIDRLFSYYQFNYGRPDKDQPLEERGRKFAKFLKNKTGTEWRKNSLVTALTYPSRKKVTSSRLQLAKKRLAQFDHVFIMDNLAEQVSVLSQYGWAHLGVAWRKASQPGETASRWSAAREALARYPKVLERLMAQNEEDLELYAFARELAEQCKSAPPRLERLAAPSTRVMPESNHFEFLIFCAYETFLKKDTAHCLKLLRSAAEQPAAKPVKPGSAEDFIAFALDRFAAPERVEKERVARSQLRAARLTAPADFKR